MTVGRDDACDSCGATGETLVTVRRVYMTPERWDQEERVEVSPDVEHWCTVCLVHYPHELVEPGPTSPAVGDSGR